VKTGFGRRVGNDVEGSSVAGRSSFRWEVKMEGKKRPEEREGLGELRAFAAYIAHLQDKRRSVLLSEKKETWEKRFRH